MPLKRWEVFFEQKEDADVFVEQIQASTTYSLEEFVYSEHGIRITALRRETLKRNKAYR